VTRSNRHSRPLLSSTSAAFPTLFFLVLTTLVLLAAGCGSGEQAGEERGAGVVDVEIPPDVLFDPAQWTTTAAYPPLGDEKALRELPERAFTITWPTFPPTLRVEGPNANLVSTSTVHQLLFESLIQIHPETEEVLPYLASHWRIENDEASGTQVFWFRIDQRARWADGEPVTAADVYYSWWHRVQEDRNDPSAYITYNEGFEEPEIVDRQTIKVRTKTANWRLFYYFGNSMLIYPAKEIAIPGEQYLREYNWRFPTGSGPYRLAAESDLRKGESLTLTRRSDWWGENEPWGRHTYNFGKVRFLVVRDEELEYEQFKQGDLDWFMVRRAQQWIEEAPREPVIQNGWVKMRKIWNKAPQGFSGLAFNQRVKPFDDRRVRLAFAHLFNRERMIEKLFFNQYELINSTEPGRDWGAGDTNPMIHFDPSRAATLLAEAGFEQRDRDGYLVGPDGKRLEVTLYYGDASLERVFLVMRDDYEAAGVKFNLELIDGSTLIKKMDDRQFTIHFANWGSLLFPNPETAWRSDLADKPANNNITGFKNARVDELLKVYNKALDRAEQKKIVREIDELICADIPYAWAWFAQYQRILYWDEYGHPESYVTRIGQVVEDDMLRLWWWDPERIAATEKARAEGRKLPQGAIEVRPWAGGNGAAPTG
jgi:microcin C transport system substrate-binding protein